MNIAQTLSDSATQWPELPAILDLDAPEGPRQLTYRETLEAVETIAFGLRELGLAQGDRVALLTGNSYEYVLTFYAIAAAELVVVPLNVRLLEDELAHIVSDTGSRLLVGDQDLIDNNRSLTDLVDLGVIATRTTTASTGRSWDTLAAAPGRCQVANVDAETPLTLIYTSGTTGKPKGVMLPHRVWSRVADDAQTHLRYVAGHERTLSAAPITHGAGFFVLPTFAAGGCNVLCSAFNAERVIEIFDEERITNLHMVPTMIRKLLDARGNRTRVGPHLKAVSYAGAPIDVVTMREAIAAFGPVMVQSFGQMEFPMFMTVLSPADHAHAVAEDPTLLESAGRAVSGVEVKIVASDGSDAANGEIGEIAGRGPHSMLGYWNQPEATAQTIKDGWVHTGDLGHIDESGYLYVSGRMKDMIISGGMNVYAREVEDVLVQIDGIKEAAVIGVPHRIWGEAVVAVLIPDADASLTTSDVLQTCRARLPGYRRPKAIKWVTEFPISGYGKVLKRELVKDFGPLEDGTP